MNKSEPVMHKDTRETIPAFVVVIGAALACLIGTVVLLSWVFA